MKTLGWLIVVGLVALGLLQLVRPDLPAPAATAEIQVPPQVRHVLEKDCYSCHSDQPRLAWFDQIVPAYWLVRHDVLTAREHLNFSTLGAKPAAAQKATLYEAVAMMQLGAMPLPRFVALHSGAKVTPEDLATLKAYLAPWTPAPQPASSAAPAGQTEPVALTAVQQEFDGFPFDPAFENWKPISFTDRGDNNTFRFILGNDVAVKAVQSGNISPWPDGARFAKIAWQQQPGPDGLVVPGKFVQVELMLKDASRYKSSDGWGWGRWRGLDLKPYGKDARFVGECTSCHLPVRGNDFIYTLPITAAHVNHEDASQDEVVNNAAAALPATLPYQPLGWSAITMYVDPAHHTMATLYGNVDALRNLSPRSADAPAAPSYPPGAVLALVTWNQRDDPHWFGARIPDAPQSIEFVEVGANRGADNYVHFVVANPAPTPNQTPDAARVKFILGLAPARLP